MQLHPCFAGDPIWSLQLSSSVLHTSLRAKLRCDVIHFGCFYIKVVAATCMAFVFPPSKQHGAPLKKAFAINFLLEFQRQDSTHFSARCRLHPFTVDDVLQCLFVACVTVSPQFLPCSCLRCCYWSTILEVSFRWFPCLLLSIHMFGGQQKIP